jgi:hypothetical protein
MYMSSSKSEVVISNNTCIIENEKFNCGENNFIYFNDKGEHGEVFLLKLYDE